ncbi:MAG: DUF4139 domain-containing protein [Planctomycetes bacterium]|nr:DUF4139 domain-containing protein [Planctomycetota bacterium]
MKHLSTLSFVLATTTFTSAAAFGSRSTNSAAVPPGIGAPYVISVAAFASSSPSASSSFADATPVESRIVDVTLYPSTALVHRTAALSGAGTFVVRGLPAGIDAENVRVRCDGGDVLDVQVKRRSEKKAPDARVQSLRERVDRLAREKQALDDDVALASRAVAHQQGLLAVDAAPRDSAASSSTAWSAHWDFVSTELATATKAARAAAWKAEDKGRELASAQQELGQLSGGGNVTVHDVQVEVVGAAPRALDVEYFVPGTGWEPLYDLRAASDLSKAQLGYRARVVQQSGEDWNDVGVALSTAQPQKGAQGPDAEPIWLAVAEQDLHRGLGYLSVEKRKSGAARLREELKDQESDDKAGAPAERPFATVESQGLSVRFQLAQKETILSRAEPTTVLVGAAELAIAPERYCVPALDATVWLRAKAKNTSPWTLLPGTAAVFFGTDYFGDAHIDTIQPGQELTLHLGADPAVTVKREQIEDLVKEPGFLSSRKSKLDTWRVHLENHGGVGANKDGSVDVIVRESLPKSRDDRVEVELSKSEPARSTDERWKQDEKDKGFLTWVLRVPKNGKQDLVWQTTITYPKDVRLIRE